MILAVVIAFTTALLAAGALNVTPITKMFLQKRSNQTTRPQGVLQDQFTEQSIIVKYSPKWGFYNIQ